MKNQKLIIKHLPTGKFIISLIGRWDQNDNLTTDVWSAAPIEIQDLGPLFNDRDTADFAVVGRTTEI